MSAKKGRRTVGISSSQPMGATAVNLSVVVNGVPSPLGKEGRTYSICATKLIGCWRDAITMDVILMVNVTRESFKHNHLTASSD